MTELPTVVVVATKNPGKAQEFKALFAKDGIAVKTLLDYPEIEDVLETGHTFEENARLKADTISATLNLPVLADDSGLMVAYLHGQPGVRSARYAGDHNDAANNAKLLSELAGVPEAKRDAKFQTDLVFAKPNAPQKDLVVTGQVAGQIALFPRGENGFGYDSLFMLPGLNKTMAEISSAQKNQLSHRGQAMAELEKKWRQWYQAD
ncbi:MAG: XTP/dITP diphosphatase [Lactobacillus sp.]|jgi:non-canonical purine NTP pyrophosphatase (RdgB/HAM1 family)|nr:XTP/dITP diphosphatase [Lactobacillus sp.]